MQNNNYRARTGGYRPAGGAPQRPRSPGQDRPRLPAQGRVPQGGTARQRPGQPTRPPGQRPPSGSRPASHSSGQHRPPQHPAQGRPAAHPSGAQRPGSQPPRRPSPHKSPRRRPRFNLFALVAIVCVVLILVYVIRVFTVTGVGSPTFIDNVTLNGMELAGLTHEQGIAKIQAVEEEWRNTVYTFSYHGQSWPFTRAMVDADADYETRIEQAWNFGHLGSIAQRRRDIAQIAENPIDVPITVTYDQDKVNAFVDEICAAIDVAPVDAVVVPDVDQPVVLTESKTGLQVNRDQLTEQIHALLTTDQVDTALPVETVFPAVNSDYSSFQVIGQYATDVSFRNGKSRTNVRIALNAFNGLSVQPGQAISFNEVVGERTESNGFQKATEYAGDVSTEGIGGGVCQASTTLYNALVMSGMTITDRAQHTMTVSYVDPSMDAAVAWEDKDLQFVNNTQYPIYIYTSVTKERATVTIYGHQPEYFYRLESVIVENDIPSTKVNYIQDTEGKFVQFTDEIHLESEGKPGCTSEGWIVAYDWNTKEEVSRTQISRDKYRPGATVYYVGVHDRADGTMNPTTQPVG